MVANNMSVFWITINPTYLRYPFVIRFADVKLELSSKIQFAFWHKTITINSVAIAKFFYIICDAIFMSLFSASQIKRGLLGPISNYFGIVEINNYGMFYLYCFV